MVIHSIEGGCPTSSAGNIGEDAGALDPTTFEYSVPQGIAPGQYALAWTWFNKVGNREMYMNCAPIVVTGGSKKRSDTPEPESISTDELEANHLNETMGVEYNLEARDASFPDMFKAVSVFPNRLLFNINANLFPRTSQLRTALRPNRQMSSFRTQDRLWSREHLRSSLRHKARSVVPLALHLALPQEARAQRPLPLRPPLHHQQPLPLHLQARRLSLLLPPPPLQRLKLLPQVVAPAHLLQRHHRQPRPLRPQQVALHLAAVRVLQDLQFAHQTASRLVRAVPVELL